MPKHAVPTFYLYGEPHRAVDADFIHVEPLDDRSRPSDWTIRPHAHAELSQLFLLSSGAGSMQADGCAMAFVAPALLVMPATIVHGFSWASDSAGWVATMAQTELKALIGDDEEIATLFAAARAAPLSLEELATAEKRMAALGRELGWSAPGRRAALRAALLDLVVLALRGTMLAPAAQAPPGRQAALVARFRERIDHRFRQREPVQRHAAALGVSESTLRAACIEIAGLSPAMMIDQRAILEARRALIYSSLPIAELGYALGFTDPAYFSRFFARHVGHSPRDHRARRGQV